MMAIRRRWENINCGLTGDEHCEMEQDDSDKDRRQDIRIVLDKIGV